jgi:hypothetical protein
MLHLLKRLSLWWLRYGEGPSFSRTLTFVGSLLTIGAVLFHRHGHDRPASIADQISLDIAWMFGVITVLIVGRSIYLFKYWRWNQFHPGGSLAARHLLNIPPEPGKDSPYSFHLAESLPELSPYVTESEYFLGESNPELRRASRFALYERWLNLNKRSFLYLSRADRKCPVALSIILPLSSTGYQRLHGIDGTHKKVIDFGEDEIRKHAPYHYLLIDTFIVSKRQERSKAKVPEPKKRYGRTLLLRHVALFWRNEPSISTNLSRLLMRQPNPHPVVIIAETNKSSLVRDLLDIGFKENGTSAIGCPLYEFQFPASDVTKEQQTLIEGLIIRIWEVKNWMIKKDSRLY